MNAVSAWLWSLFAIALLAGYLAFGVWFRNRSALRDAKGARSAWHIESYVRSSFYTRQAISLFLWPFKLIAWSFSGIGRKRFERYDPVALRRREERIALLERELLGRSASRE